MSDENETVQQQPGREASDDISDLLAFSVTAGKFEGDNMNCKYAADFARLDDAITAYDEMAGYPWRYIQYAGRTIDVYPIDFKPFE